LGAVFLAKGTSARLLRSVIRRLYRVAFGHPNQCVIFQNPDDLEQFVSQQLVSPAKATIIRGSGVDLGDYPSLPEPEGRCVVTMAARLLVDKTVFNSPKTARPLRVNGSTWV
jgi:predicted RNA-binding Zn ribbon-like protein